MLRRVGLPTIEKTFGKNSPEVAAAKTLDTRGPQVFNAKSMAANNAVETWEAENQSRLLFRDEPGATAAGATINRLLTDTTPAKTANVSGTRVITEVTDGPTSLPVDAFGPDLKIAAELAAQHAPAGQTGVTSEGIAAAAYADPVFRAEAFSEMRDAFRNMTGPTRTFRAPPEQDIALTSSTDPVLVRFQLKHETKPSSPFDGPSLGALSYQISTGVPGAIVAVTGEFDNLHESRRNFSAGHRTKETQLFTADAAGNLSLPLATLSAELSGEGAATANGDVMRRGDGGRIMQTREAPATQALRIFKPAEAGKPIEPLFALDVKLAP